MRIEFTLTSPTGRHAVGDLVVEAPGPLEALAEIERLAPGIATWAREVGVTVLADGTEVGLAALVYRGDTPTVLDTASTRAWLAVGAAGADVDTTAAIVRDARAAIHATLVEV